MKKIDYFKKWANLKLQSYDIQEQQKTDLVCLSKNISEQLTELFRDNFNMPEGLHVISDISNGRIYLSKDLDANYWSNKDITIKLDSKNIQNVSTGESTQVKYLKIDCTSISIDPFNVEENFDIDNFLRINNLKLDISEQFIYQSQFYQELLSLFVDDKSKNIKMSGVKELETINNETLLVRNDYLTKMYNSITNTGFELSNYMTYYYKQSESVYLRGKIRFTLNPGGKTFTINTYNSEGIKTGSYRSKIAYVFDLIVNYLKEQGDIIAKNIDITCLEDIDKLSEYYEPTNKSSN